MADEDNLDLDEIDDVDEETPNEVPDLDDVEINRPTSARDLEAVYDIPVQYQQYSEQLPCR